MQLNPGLLKEHPGLLRMLRMKLFHGIVSQLLMQLDIIVGKSYNSNSCFVLNRLTFVSSLIQLLIAIYEYVIIYFDFLFVDAGFVVV